MSNKNKKNTLKRKFISLEDKIRILDRLKNEERSSAIAKSLNLNEATIRTIKKNEEKIRTSVSAGSPISAKRVARTREIIMEKMEKSLMIWIEDCTNKLMPLDGNIIKQKALRIYKQLKQVGESSSEHQSNHEFSASKGWFENFKKRFSLHKKLQGETASPDVDAARGFTEDFAKIIKKEGYTSDQVFNVVETGLHWKKMPQRTYISKDEKSTPGFKASKDKITILLCSNASGDFMLKPMFINRSLNPLSMKNLDKSTLPVYWRANRKGWVIGSLFKDWFYNCFVPDVESYMKMKNVNFKILLVLCNAPGHPKELTYPNIQTLFLPPNTSSIIQPLDQGAVSTFKAYYIRRTFQSILDKIESNSNTTVTQLWKDFSILNCVEIVSLSLKELQSSTLNACWKATWPEVVQSEIVINPADIEYNHIINIAHSLGGEGFDDMAVQDVHELIADDELNEEEMVALTIESYPNFTMDNGAEDSDSDVQIENFTLKSIKEGLELAKKLEYYFTDKDPSIERSGKFKKQLQNCLAPYREIYKELQTERKQLVITDFLEVSLAKDAEEKKYSHEEDVQPVAKRCQQNDNLTNSNEEHT